MIKERASITEFSKTLEPISNFVVWSYVARRYFDKSPAWLTAKRHGYDGNGGTTDFTDEEKEILKNALFDMADTMRKVAEKID